MGDHHGLVGIVILFVIVACVGTMLLIEILSSRAEPGPAEDNIPEVPVDERAETLSEITEQQQEMPAQERELREKLARLRAGKRNKTIIRLSLFLIGFALFASAAVRFFFWLGTIPSWAAAIIVLLVLILARLDRL